MYNLFARALETGRQASL